MSFNLDDVNVGGQLKVGTGIVPAIKEGDERINGSMYAEGPVVLGGPTEFGENQATLMVGRTKNNDKDCEPADRSLYVKGNTFIEGDDGTPHAVQVTGNLNITGNQQTDQCVNIFSSTDTAIKVNNVTTIDKFGDAIFAIGTNGQTLSSRFSSADARPKPFDIEHPSRDGYRLRYACVEGPEVAVYFRGRVKNEKVIILPSYWKDFVYEDSISVQLQPIGAHQDVIVKRWDSEKIYLQSRGGMPIDCFFHVYAERNDINPLITEYEGESCQDYPDPNHHQIPESDRNYKDPNYAREQNTRTK